MNIHLGERYLNALLLEFLLNTAVYKVTNLECLGILVGPDYHLQVQTGFCEIKEKNRGFRITKAEAGINDLICNL